MLVVFGYEVKTLLRSSGKEAELEEDLAIATTACTFVWYTIGLRMQFLDSETIRWEFETMSISIWDLILEKL